MHQFYVRFTSLQDVQDFVNYASRESQRITVGNSHFQVNATSFMGLLALNCRNPLLVTVSCADEELQQLKTTFQRFLVE